MPYLDHAGCTLPSKTQLEEVFKLQSQLILANPHSHHATAIKTQQIIDGICCVEEDLAGDIPEVRNSLFAFTAMSNFCGKKYDLGNITKLQEKGWSVLLDAAGLVSTSPLDLSSYRPNFVAFSFYKMFGYPTGLGALLVKKDSAHTILKTSFAGGTVQSVDDTSLFYLLRDSEQAFEEGTLNYYGIAQLQKGFEDLDRYGGIKSIQKITHTLRTKTFEMLQSKKHPNGRKVVEIYSQSKNPEGPDKQGAVVAFNLKRPDGGYYGYTEVEKMCAIFGIELRTGCFCNIGACKKYLGITSEMITENMSKGKRCGDEIDLINGRPTGAIRVSFGRMSTDQDIKALEQMIDTCFVSGELDVVETSRALKIELYSPTIVNLFSFPIKSVGSIGRDRYDLTARGFKHDRDFLIVKDDVTLNLKMHPELCRLTAIIVDDEKLQIQTFDQNDNFVIPMNLDLTENDAKVVCKKTIATLDCGDKVGKWLEDALDMPNCRLLRVAEESKKNFVNDSPFLVINEASVYMLSRHINMEVQDILTRFRSNIVVRGLPPFIEDAAKRLSIMNLEFEVVDKCTRCEMICVDPMTGEKDPALLLALRDYRNKQKVGES
uniref:MOSC domain-containing protein n=1 Tax=Caenorhabditis tropicalis TaxID=1561998 RepID=A0A1I7T9U5_9PELO